MTNSNGSDLVAGTAASDTINSVNENIGAGSPVRCAMDIHLCRGHPAGASDLPTSLASCRRGPRNAEKKTSDDFQVDLSDRDKHWIAYAAKVAELQYKQAKRICDEINGISIGIDDPMVLAVLKAISTNYAALVPAAELRTCSCSEAAEFDTQIPRITARSRPGQIR